MKRVIFVCLVMFALNLSGTCATAAENPPVKVTGLFSDMAYNRDGGDVIGIEVFITYSGKGYFVVYQSAEGEPTVPVVVPAKISGTSISFDVPADTDPRGSFTGTMNAHELVGAFSGNQTTVHLRRKASYWQ